MTLLKTPGPDATPEERQRLLEQLFIRNQVRRETGRDLLDIPTEYAERLQMIRFNNLNAVRVPDQKIGRDNVS